MSFIQIDLTFVSMLCFDLDFDFDLELLLFLTKFFPTVVEVV